MGNKSLKAYQIVIKGNKVSEEYARISRESFEPLVAAGIIDEIITFDAITPDSDNFDEHVAKYNWSRSLMKGDLVGSRPEDHSPTEKAGMCSHWELMQMASESNDRFLVLEHDTYFKSECFDIFCELLNMIEEEEVCYANIGLFMGCYTLDKHSAKWMYEILTKHNFPINCGPYCTLQRLFATYTSDWLKRPEIGFYGIDPSVIHPWFDCDTLYFGRNVQIPFNKKDKKRNDNIWITPTTQVISKSLSVTQHHHGYRQGFIDEPWSRHSYFHVID